MPNNINLQPQFIQSGNPETENRAPTLYDGLIGAHLTVRDPLDSNKAKGYQCVVADSVMDVPPAENLVAYWLSTSGYLVTTDVSVAGRGNVAGVFRCDVDLGNICYIQLKGLGGVQFKSGPTASPTTAGLIVIPYSTDGEADCLAAGSPATYPPLGTSAGAPDGDDVALVNLDLEGRP